MCFLLCCTINKSLRNIPNKGEKDASTGGLRTDQFEAVAIILRVNSAVDDTTLQLSSTNHSNVFQTITIDFFFNFWLLRNKGFHYHNLNQQFICLVTI